MNERSRDRAPVMRENVYGHQKRLRFLLERIENLREAWGLMPEQVRVLDVGCGTGVMITRPLAEQGYQVTGLDIDKESIVLARDLHSAASLPNLRFVEGSIEMQPWVKVFHAVICSEVLEHQPNPSALIRSMRKCITDSGLLLITVPNGYGLFELDSFLWHQLNRIRGFSRVALAAEIRLKQFFLRLIGSQLDLAVREYENSPERRATLNERQPHCQFFTWTRLCNLVSQSGFSLIASANSSFWAGPLANYVLREFNTLIRINTRVADFLPRCAASGWYLCFTPSPSPERTDGAGIKQRTVRHWTATPIGTQTTGFSSPHEPFTKPYFDDNARFRYETYAPWIREVAGFDRHLGKRVLEVGCGMGTDLLEFAKGNANVIGIDLTPRHLKLSRKRFELNGFKGNFVVADAESLPFQDASFDHVYSIGVLHHIPHPRLAAAEIHRVLKPGGEALVILYHKQSLHYWLRVVVQQGGKALIRAMLQGHPWSISLSRLLSASTDGLQNPLTKAFSRREGEDLFRSFHHVQSSIAHLNPDDFPGGALLPRRALQRLARYVGWYLILRATK